MFSNTDTKKRVCLLVPAKAIKEAASAPLRKIGDFRLGKAAPNADPRPLSPPVPISFLFFDDVRSLALSGAHAAVVFLAQDGVHRPAPI